MSNSAGSSPAAAQIPVPNQELSAATYTPAVGRNNYFAVDGASTPGHIAPFVGLSVDYAYRPLVLYRATCANPDGTSCRVISESATLVENFTTFNVMGSIALWDRLQIGLVLPVGLTNGQRYAADPGVGGPVLLAAGGFHAGVGDIRITAKVNAVSAGGFGLGVVAYGTIPAAQWTAQGGNLGDRSPIFGGHVVGEFQTSGFRIAGNLGGFWRDSSAFLSTTTGPRLTYGLATGYDFTPLVGAFLEVNGGTAFANAVDENALEGRLGGRFQFDDFTFQLGGGPGIVAGVGVPVFRVLGSFAWAPNLQDTDQDGILDRDDQCPAEAEDRDGYDDRDGCKDDDDDGDGVPDVVDQCREEPEDADGRHDEDGCPDRDDDGDGVVDGYDSCPEQPEDMDGDRDEDGCPEEDRDRDNINDNVDQCPDQAEDTDGYGDEDGCPEEDFDNDRIPDNADQCPDQPEDRDRFEDTDGCPEEGGPPSDGARRGRRPRE